MFVEKKITTIYSHRQTTSKLLKSLHPFQMCINTLPYTAHTRTNPNSKIKSDSLNWHYTRHALKWELTFISAHIHTQKHMCHCWSIYLIRLYLNMMSVWNRPIKKRRVKNMPENGWVVYIHVHHHLSIKNHQNNLRFFELVHTFRFSFLD